MKLLARVGQRTNLRAAGERRFDGRDDLRHVQRLHKITERTELGGTLDDVRIAVRGQKHEGQAVLCSQTLGQLHAGDVGHAHVEQRQIGFLARNHGERRRTVARFADAIAGVPQAVPERREDESVIVYDQNMRAGVDPTHCVFPLLVPARQPGAANRAR